MALPKKYDFNDYDNYLTDPNPTTTAEAQDYFRNMDMLVTAMVDTFLWQPGTNYANGDVVKSPSMPNGVEAVCVAEKGGKSSNVEPQWGNVGGENIADGTCFWKLRWVHWSKEVASVDDMKNGTSNDKLVTPKLARLGQTATNRLTNTAYTVGNVVYVDSNLSVALKCTTSGTTANTELDISNKVVGDSVTDNTCVWKLVTRDLTTDVTNVMQTVEQVQISVDTLEQGVGTAIDYIVESYRNGTSWYEVYKSGKIRQGGQITLNADDYKTVTLLKPFANTSYFVGFQMGVTGNYEGFDVGTLYFSAWGLTKNSFKTYMGQFEGLNCKRWVAEGQGA